MAVFSSTKALAGIWVSLFAALPLHRVTAMAFAPQFQSIRPDILIGTSLLSFAAAQRNL
jgi:hypothetical protein